MSEAATPTKRRYQIRNWAQYNAALKARGSLTIWLDRDMQWLARPSGKRGRQQTFSDASIQFCLSLKCLLNLPLRQTLGLVQSLLQLASLDWPSTLDATVVAAALLPAKNMSTLDLWRYSTHLTRQAQDSQRHAIQFWKKALYPLACLVMVALALPFAYLSARRGGISFKVFGGILLGISFVLLNSVSGHLGVLRDWTPWLAAAVPGLVYIALSLGAFAWLVRDR